MHSEIYTVLTEKNFTPNINTVFKQVHLNLMAYLYFMKFDLLNNEVHYISFFTGDTVQYLHKLDAKQTSLLYQITGN